MIAWLWGLIVGQFCNHIWVDDGHQNIVNSSGIKVKDAFYLRCTKCGDVKCRRF
jgi:hypothetical protein